MQLQDFPDHFRRHFPELVGQSVLVALSGGADSTALLYLLADPSLGLELRAAYIHHRTREAEAAAELARCAAHCRTLGIPFESRELATGAGGAAGLEATWRKQRYTSLLRLARDHGVAAVATGHHRDDIAEGVLVQLLRGAGPRAMAGIAAMTATGVIRPLLPWSRAEIVAWLEERAIRWCEDSSNRDQAHLRNRVRHGILPVLEAASPRAREHLVHLARVLAEDEACLHMELARSARWLDVWHPDGGVPLGYLAAYPAALRSRWLHAQAARLGLERVSRRQIQLFNQLLDHGEPRALNLQQRWRIRAVGGCLWGEPPAPPADYRLRLEDGSEHPLPIPGWYIACADGVPDRGREGWRWDAPEHGVLSVRPALSAEPGEPVRSREKLRRLVVERLPRHLRATWPGIFIGDTIAWIPGVWMAATVGSRCTRSVEVFRR